MKNIQPRAHALYKLLALIILMPFAVFSSKAQTEATSSPAPSYISAANIAVDNTLSMQTTPDVASLGVYPNPASDEVNLVFNSSQYNDRYEVRIINNSGIQLKYIEGTTLQGENTINFHVGDYPAGVYYVQLLTTTGKETLKFLKQNSE